MHNNLAFTYLFISQTRNFRAKHNRHLVLRGIRNQVQCALAGIESLMRKITPARSDGCRENRSTQGFSEIPANLRLVQDVPSARGAPFRINVRKRFRVYQVEVTQTHRFHSPRSAADVTGMAGMA